MGVFSESQPVYAEHGIATFPVEITRGADGQVGQKADGPEIDHRMGRPASGR